VKKIFLIALALVPVFLFSCKKDSDSFENINTPRSSVPGELVGRWAIVSISGSTVYDIPSGYTSNTNESFLGYQINSDGTLREDGYMATYQYGVSTWAKWSAVGSVQLEDGAIAFHRARGSYTSSRNSASTHFGSAEVYPNKSFYYVEYEIGQNSRGETTLFLLDSDGYVHQFVKQ